MSPHFHHPTPSVTFLEGAWAAIQDPPSKKAAIEVRLEEANAALRKAQEAGVAFYKKGAVSAAAPQIICAACQCHYVIPGSACAGCRAVQPGGSDDSD